MAKRPAKEGQRYSDQFHEAETKRLFGQSQFHRFARVIAAGIDGVEVAPRDGCRITVVDEVQDGRRRTRILVGTIPKPPPKPAPGD